MEFEEELHNLVEKHSDRHIEELISALEAQLDRLVKQEKRMRGE